MVVYLGKATPASGSGGGSGDAVWGSITGTLSDQTDLATALADKQDTLTAGEGISITNNVISATGGSVSYDGTTISENASNELQAIGVKEARTDTAIRLWHGTEEQWEQGGASQTWYNWKYAASGSWTSETSGVSVNLLNAAYGNNKYVVVGYNGTILSSSNGSSWTSETSGVSVQLYDVCYGDNKFVAVGNEGTILTSSDGSTWTNVSLGIQRSLFAVIYADNKFIAVGGFGAIFISSNGSNWAEVTGISGQLSGIAYGNNKFIIVGDRKIYSSSDGSTWTEETSGVSEKWNGIAFGNNKFVVIGDDGTVLSSSDGSSWTEEVEADFESFKGIAFGNNTFKIVGVVSYVLTSSDGSTWTRENISTSSLKGVDLCNNKFIAVGNSGTMMSYSQTILSCFTSEAEPTTESTVYSAPDTASALTITAVGTGTITLSDTNTYDYNASGNQTTYQSIGEAYPNYVCNIDNVGLKIGTTDIANLASYSAFGGATGSVAGSAGLVPAPTTSNVDSYLKGDGTWATLSALENTATGEDSLTILGTPTTIGLSLNIGSGSSVTGSGEDCCGIAIGNYSSATDYCISLGSPDYNGSYTTTSGNCSIAIGSGAQVTGGDAIGSIALGYAALCSANSGKGTNNIAIGQNAETQNTNYSIQLGTGKNSTDNTFSVGFGFDQNNNPLNYKLLDGTTGKIPNDRINGATGSFTSQDGKTVTVTNGVITSIV